MARPKKSKAKPEAIEEIPAELKPGYIIDFISGLPVKDSPEERDAVQVFARRLVEDYGYAKELIQTRPQYRVRKRPSDEEKSYPVDIAVFRSAKKLEDELKNRGGIYTSKENWASYVVTDGLLITGQNPASSKEAAEKLVELLHDKSEIIDRALNQLIED